MLAELIDDMNLQVVTFSFIVFFYFRYVLLVRIVG